MPAAPSAMLLPLEVPERRPAVGGGALNSARRLADICCLFLAIWG
jgi:hypothetical protein